MERGGGGGRGNGVGGGGGSGGGRGLERRKAKQTQGNQISATSLSVDSLASSYFQHSDCLKTGMRRAPTSTGPDRKCLQWRIQA